MRPKSVCPRKFIYNGIQGLMWTDNFIKSLKFNRNDKIFYI